MEYISVGGTPFTRIRTERWQPKMVLLSVAAGDAQERLDLQALQGHTLLRTDRNGWIKLSTDRENLWVKVEKK